MRPIDWAVVVVALLAFFTGATCGSVVQLLANRSDARSDYQRGRRAGWIDREWRARDDGDHWPYLCPGCGRDLFTTETILPDGSVGCECKLERREK